MKTKSKKCKHCGKLFFKKDYNSKKVWSLRKFCTVSCSRKTFYEVGGEPWNKGKKWTEFTNEGNPFWKGERVSYAGIHKWVSRHLGKPSTCEHCKKTGLTGQRIHWANVSGDYLRDLEDWIRLCPKCHKAFDRNR